MISTRPARAPGDVTRQLADHRRVLDEVARTPMLNAQTIEVELPNGVPVTTQHALGRAYTQILLSPPQGAVAAGYITETPTANSPREFVLTANGYGAAITVRATVF